MKKTVVLSHFFVLLSSSSVFGDDKVLNVPANTKVETTTTTLSQTYPDGVNFEADSSVLAITQDSSGPPYEGPISGSGTLTINTLPSAIIKLGGSGTTYTGDTQINSGTLSTFAETVSHSFNFIAKHANLTLSLGDEETFPGGISGPGSLTVTGGGKLILISDPINPSIYNYSGGTNIEGSILTGSVNISSDKDSIGTIPATGSINLSERGIITFEQPSTATNGIFSGNITGEGKVIVGGQQPLTLTSTSNTYSEGTVIGDVRPSRGQLIGRADLIQDGNVITPGSLQGNIEIYSGTLTFNQQGSTEILAYRFSGKISNTSNLPNSVTIEGNTGPFILNLAETNSYNGATTVNTNATLQGTLPNSTINLAVTGATYDLNGADQMIGGLEGITNTFVNLGDATLTVGGNSATTTFSGTIQDGGLEGSLIKTGSGSLTLTNPTSYTGTTTIAEGTLTLNPASSGLTTNIINNSTLSFTPTIQGFVPFNGDISGTGSLSVESTVGPFTLNLVGRNSYTGATTIGSNTTLQARLPESTFLILNAGGATFDLNGNNQTVAVLNGNTGTFVNLGANTLTVDGNESPSTFSGVIQDNGMGGHLVKRGSQNLTLGTPPTYSGSTTIAGGSLTGQLPMNAPLIVNNGTFEMVVSQIFTTLEGRGGNIILGNSSTPYNLTVLGDSSHTKYTFAGSITGGGQLTLGSGTTTEVLELTGTNSYTGNTTIFAGSTLIGSTSNFPSAGFITNSGKLIFNQSTEGTYAGIIAGSGNVEVTGGGKLTLTAIGNSYSKMTVNQGTTLVANTNALPAAPIIIDSKAALVFNQNFSGTFSSVISGKGALQLLGGGALTLTGKNTYTGDTSIARDGSNLIINILSDTSSSLPPTSNVIDDGTLTFNFTQPISGAFTFGGNIKGLGDVVIIGGTVNLTGINKIKGGITTQNGSSVTGNTDSLTGDIVDNGVVTFNQAAAGTYAGKISGTGSLIKEGAGRLALTGISPLSGPTTVKKGILAVNGSLGNSLVTVAQEGTLRGSGAVGGVHLKGTIAPGNSIGTLRIRNDFIMEPTSTYEVEITPHAIKPRNSDHLMIGGKANLAGTLHVKVLGGPRGTVKNQRFMCLGARKGRFGEFSNLVSDDRLKYKVLYFTKGIEVFVTSLQDFADASSAGSKSNVARTERYFDTFADNTAGRPDLRHVINILDGLLLTENAAVVNNAFNQIQPAQYGELGGISFLHNELVNKTVSTQQQYLRESRWIDTELRHREGVFSNFSSKQLTEFRKLVDDKLLSGFNTFEQVSKNQIGPRANFLALGGETKAMRPGNQRIRVGKSSLWVQSYGQIEKSKSNHGNPSIRSQTGGLSIGGDHEVLCNTYLGILGGFSTTPFHWGQDRGYGKMKSYYGGLYGTWLSQTGLYADGQIIAGGDQFHSKRNIKFPGINRVAKQGHKAGQFSANAEVGYAWMLQPFTLQPFLDGTYMFAKEQGFREKGAQSLNFRIKSKTSQFLRGEVGAQIYRTYVLCDALVRPAFQLSYVHKHPISGTHVKGGIIGEPQSLTLLGDSKVRNQVAPGVGVTVQFTKGLYIIANVSAQLGSGQNLGDALVRVGYDF